MDALSFYDYYRIFFWVYVVCLICHLVDVDDYKKQLKLNRLNALLVFNCFVLGGIIACGIYDPVAPIGLTLLAYVLFAVLIFIVWYCYLPKIVSSNKVYQMDIWDEKTEQNEHFIYGTIRERGFMFTAVKRLDEKGYKAFNAKRMGSKTVEVTVISRTAKDDDYATLEVK